MEAEKSTDICLQIGDLGKLAWYSFGQVQKSIFRRMDG